MIAPFLAHPFSYILIMSDPFKRNYVKIHGRSHVSNVVKNLHILSEFCRIPHKLLEKSAVKITMFKKIDN